jgi:hypothetical protein
MSGDPPGEYRYVRGRVVDPETGRPSGDEAIPSEELVEANAQALAQSAAEVASSLPESLESGAEPEPGPDPAPESELAAPPQAISEPASEGRVDPLAAIMGSLEEPLRRSPRPRRRGIGRTLALVGSGAAVAVAGMWLIAGARAPGGPSWVVEIGRSRTVPVTRIGSPARPVVPVTPIPLAQSRGTAARLVVASRAGLEQTPAIAVAAAPKQAATDAIAGEAVAPVLAQPSEDEIPPAALAPAPAPVAVPTVTISINATPWATIEIDGEPVGETPLSGVRLPVGRHRFVARMPDGSVRERVTHLDGDSEAVLFE